MTKEKLTKKFHVPWEDIFKLSASAGGGEICEGVSGWN